MSSNSLLINVDIAETRVALIESGSVTELFLERTHERSPVGNIYLGKVTRVLPGMQAAFIDIGLDRAAFLHVEDVVPQEDMNHLMEADRNADPDDGDGDENGEKKSKKAAKTKTRKVTRATPIRDVLKEGQSLMVQVSKGPIGTKGARVTSHISMPGRYVVYLPTVDHIGISKRIGNENTCSALGCFKQPSPSARAITTSSDISRTGRTDHVCGTTFGGKFDRSALKRRTGAVLYPTPGGTTRQRRCGAGQHGPFLVMAKPQRRRLRKRSMAASCATASANSACARA